MTEESAVEAAALCKREASNGEPALLIISTFFTVAGANSLQLR